MTADAEAREWVDADHQINQLCLAPAIAAHERLTMILETTPPSALVHGIVRQRGSVRFWVLVGYWHGMPCAIQRGDYKPYWTVWSLTDEKQWHELRRDGFYTRRSRSRPTDYVDRQFQNTTKPDVLIRAAAWQPDGRDSRRPASISGGAIDGTLD